MCDSELGVGIASTGIMLSFRVRLHGKHLDDLPMCCYVEQSMKRQQPVKHHRGWPHQSRFKKFAFSLRKTHILVTVFITLIWIWGSELVLELEV